MQNDTKKNKNIRYKITISIVALVFLIYLIINIYNLIKQPTNIFIVEEGNLSQTEDAVCYIIRDETILQGENYKNGMSKIMGEGEKVQVGAAVFRYYTKNEDELVKKIAELDTKIEEAMESETLNFNTSDAIILESKIESKMNELYGQTDLSIIKQVKQEMQEATTKKATIAGELSPANSYIKKLIDERADYENKLNSGAETVTTNTAGVVSYKIDGLENILTTTDFFKLNHDFLNNLNIKTGQVITSSEEAGKIINNFKFYIAVELNSQEAKEAKNGDAVKISLGAGKTLKANIVHINEEESGKRIIVFETTDYTQELISYRKLSCEIIWWSSNGLKVPNSAITKENNLDYVIRNRAGYLDKILVNVLKQNENYSLVSKYSVDELKKLGFSSKEIINMKNISIYDEVLANASKE